MLIGNVKVMYNL